MAHTKNTVTICIDRDTMKKDVSDTTGRNVVFFNLMKNNIEVSHKLTIKLLYDPEIPLLGVYPQDIHKINYSTRHTHIVIYCNT